MLLTIHFGGADVSKKASAELMARVAESLARYEQQVRSICFYIDDINGPRGGVDKQCRCVMQVAKLAPIVIEDRGDRLGTLLDRVSHRARYVLSQKLSRRSERKRQGVPVSGLLDVSSKIGG